MENYILQVNNIKKRFGGVRALRGVDLNIKRGEIHCLAGENGCGKSTLIKIISGFYTPDEGEIIINGISQKQMTTKLAIDYGIQVIYQDFSIFPNLTVKENIALNVELAENKKFINEKKMYEIAKNAVDKIGFKVDLNEIVENLSVSDKQLIAISRALINDAKLIIMDEPTTALTKKEIDALFEIIKELQKKDIAVLFVSHKLDEVFEISDRFTIFRNGENVASGDTNELDDKKFSYYMTGRKFDGLEETNPINSAEEILRVENLTLENGYKDISFSLNKGEILGITGLLGSGRTELAQSIFGYRIADEGKIYIENKEIKIKNVKDAVHHGIGYVPEDRLTEGLFLEQSISDNISVLKWDEFSNLINIVNKDKVSQVVDKWVDKFSIAIGEKENAVQTLSGGNQQKCLLARWLSIDLKVLILNGPTVGVDIGAKYDIHQIIKTLAQEEGIAFIIISDDIPEILNTCHQVIIMNNGKLSNKMDTKTLDVATLSQLAINE